MKRPPLSVAVLFVTWFVAWFVFLPPVRADDVPSPSPELRKAFVSYVELLGSLAKQRADSGIPMRVVTDKELPEIQKRCDAIIAAAGNRQDFVKAARFCLSAANYAARHPLAEGGPLEIPDDKELAAVLKDKSGTITEKRVDGACFVALIRLAKLFGPVDATEDSVMRCPEILGVKRLPKPADQDKPVTELTLSIAAAGTVSIDGAAVADKDLTETLKRHVKQAAAAGRELVVTITGDKTTTAKRIQSVMEHCDQAGIINISFKSSSSPQ